MTSFKKLAGDTAIYGVSSIVGRFINWWLVPYYSHIFITADYGVVTNMYSYMAFLLVLLTYGMETGYFRFASKNKNKDLVYSSSMISLIITSLSFLIFIFTFSDVISGWMDYSNHPEYIRWIGCIMALDAVTAIPFARLRIEGKAIRFASVKLINIFFNIFSNIFFLTICPAILKNNPQSIINLIYSPNIGVGYVFISNLIASGVTFILLIPEFRFKLRIDKHILIKIVSYSFPILIVGIAGMVNQNIDKILIPKLMPENQHPMAQLGIYGANYKLAVLMNMFIQAFRYAFEPFFFSQVKSEDTKRGYALILKYFVILGLFIFLSVSLFLDVFKSLHIISAEYFTGLRVVPYILMANLFLGIYYTLSLWYKLTDKTYFGAYFAIIGAVINLTINILFIPKYGYMASAISVLICFFIMMVLSYYIGQKHYYIPYPIKRIGIYFVVALTLYFITIIVPCNSLIWYYGFHLFILMVFIFVVYMLEKKKLIKLMPHKNKI
ncbi:MAG: polysaccharide biosynthesis C-terminal domain-containing protein [Prolixibacteraceae bacterium]|nr:polysaccharide biosynthesis C-terminal domain-containing protein [Prolixibacteraceae bacterium]